MAPSDTLPEVRTARCDELVCTDLSRSGSVARGPSHRAHNVQARIDLPISRELFAELAKSKRKTKRKAKVPLCGGDSKRSKNHRTSRLPPLPAQGSCIPPPVSPVAQQPRVEQSSGEVPASAAGSARRLSTPVSPVAQPRVEQSSGGAVVGRQHVYVKVLKSTRKRKCQYLVWWEGDQQPSWEPKSSFRKGDPLIKLVEKWYHHKHPDFWSNKHQANVFTSVGANVFALVHDQFTLESTVPVTWKAAAEGEDFCALYSVLNACPQLDSSGFLAAHKIPENARASLKTMVKKAQEFTRSRICFARIRGGQDRAAALRSSSEGVYLVESVNHCIVYDCSRQLILCSDFTSPSCGVAVDDVVADEFKLKETHISVVYKVVKRSR